MQEPIPRQRISDHRLAFYENSIARQIRIIRRIQRLAGLLDVVSLRMLSPLINDVIQLAGQTIEALQTAMNEEKEG